MQTLKNRTKTLVDVRTPQEYAQHHAPEAINIPLDQVANRLPEFTKMQKPIVAYCRSGNRSAMAVQILKQNGISDVYNGGALEEIMMQLA